MIIGICGLIGSGKGTVADILVEQGYKKISFADKLKDGVATIFGWDRAMLEGDTDEGRESREQADEFWTAETGRTITPRIVLQEFGTECMRDGFYNGVWVSLLKKYLIDHPGDYIVPDVRFRNEQNMIRKLGGKIWQVKRGKDPEWFARAIFDNNNPKTSNLMSGIDVHESEYKWIDVNTRFDSILHNDSTVDDLKSLVLDQISNTPR